MRVSSVALCALALASTGWAVKEHDFKKCHQSGFCKRGRALSERASAAGQSWSSPYALDTSALSFASGDAVLTAPVKSSLYPNVHFELKVSILKNGVARVQMDEVGGLRQRYNEAAKWALVSEPALKDAKQVEWIESANEHKAVFDGVELRLQHTPLRVSLWRDGREEVVLNDRGLLHMEHFREKGIAPPAEAEDGQTVIGEPSVNPNAWFEGETEESLWEESFGSWTDSKPKGPESLSLDIDFPHKSHIYGIPQHAAPLSLPPTTGENAHYSQPFRLYNGDIFEYLADSSDLSLYGSIPLLHAANEHSIVGVFNLLASETWIDVAHPPSEGEPSNGIKTHWIAESGVMDIFLLPGPNPRAVFSQYASLTGTSAMPAQWALGHHQCRWNYISTDDVRSVSKRFDEEDMPVDVLWLDIEYAEEHKYMIWEQDNFPDPVEMTDDIAAVGRKMVVIVDPHLKRVASYPVYSEAEKASLVVKKSDNADYEGWCWSGSSAWVDFFNPASTEWWKGLFQLTDGKSQGWRWKESTPAVFIWNDMNEPAVFNGPEITMPKDNIHHGGWEHRDVHNANGMLFHRATALALVNRTSTVPHRPFVLSRSFFAGSQRWGAVWTGDNMGTWEHMAVGIRMTLTDSIAGMQFIGADVGGFFGNPSSEMLVRWYQVGAFAPFFRAHAHIDTKRREPYLLDEPYKSMLRDILKLRYTLLPVWYTAAREASAIGVPTMRPQYVMFPRDERGFGLDDQYYVGNSGLLVKPITVEGQTSTEVYLSDDQVYYDYFDHTAYHGERYGGTYITMEAPLDKVPLLIRGGSVVPTRQRPRRASTAMKYDPFTLTFALASSPLSTSSSSMVKEEELLAEGELYLDDGETYAHTQGALIWRGFTASRAQPKRKTKHSQLKTSSLTLRSRDLVLPSLAQGLPVVEASNTLTAPSTLSASTYDPVKNAYAQSIAGIVGVERIVVLGLEGEPASVSAGEKKLEFVYEAGVGGGSRQKGKASRLIVKNPGVGVVEDWDLTITFGA